MKNGRLYTEQEIQIIAKSSIGKSINQIEKEKMITIEDKNSNKGGLGQLVEKYLFDIDNNNESEPDFINAGIELKVTPYKKLKNNQLSAKERLVLNIIDYQTEYKNTFKNSQFWHKNNKLQILWYLWEPNKTKKEYIITNEKLLNLALSEDLPQIEKDWNYIIQKIKDGKAHEISEGDTMYLGACCKGNKDIKDRKQPFNDIDAKQRAFDFKTSYMTQLVRKYMGNYKNVEKILNNNETFDNYIEKVISKYIGKSTEELKKIFKIDSKSKSINRLLINKMFNINGDIGKTEEFLKAKIIPKTIRIEKNVRIKESISFPAFKYKEIINQDWETCDLKEELETTKYMFFVFKKEKNDYIFKGVKLWNMPEIDIETKVMSMWVNTYNTIKTGNIIKEIKNGKRKTNFIGTSSNEICHVRPHARNAKDTYPLPVKDKLTGLTEYTKQCFWLNNNYILKIFSDINK